MGAGVTQYDGTPFVVQPPLYPALLALASLTTGADPLLFAHSLNAFLFGLIVYGSGVLMFRHLASFPGLALLGTLAIVFSEALFQVSVMAWSEPLFICCVLLSVICAYSYHEKRDVVSLLLLAVSVALASMTRYIGVILMFWGAIVILISTRYGTRNRTPIGHLALFFLVAGLPLGLWLLRNYSLTDTLLGSRAPSALTLPQNLELVFDTLLHWYIPGTSVKGRLILLLVGLALVSLAVVKRIGLIREHRAQESYLLALFTVSYIVFLVISASTTAYDQINNRLLSPAYVPLTVLLLISVQALFTPDIRQREARPRWKPKRLLLVVGVAIWLVYPMLATARNAINLMADGQGFSSKTWRESETIQYILQHQSMQSECVFYTNAPDATYILANLVAEVSPAKTGYNSSEEKKDISSLKGVWPGAGGACLIWFDAIDAEFLFKAEELRDIANFDRIAGLNDGAIYAVSRYR